MSLPGHSLELDLPYPPVTGNHAVRHTSSGRHYLTSKYLGYIADVKAAVGSRKAPEGRITTDWLIAPPDRKARDIDNLLKVVKDALTKAGFWADDNNKVIPRGSWRWSDPIKGGAITLLISTEETR